jgi:predicted RNA binding protein with dsRBD fold (UPF0201 family)
MAGRMSGISKIEIAVEIEVNPTEDLDKVRVAVYRVLGELPILVLEDEDGKCLIGKSEDPKTLSRFHELLRKEQIMDAARRVLSKGLQENTLTFYLNKQVAYAGHISFSQSMGESPLGPIRIEIQCDRPQELIEWLAPKTTQRY